MNPEGIEIETYIDVTFFVSDQEVPEEPGFIEITEPYHVIHTLDGGGVHGLDGALCLLVDLVFLYLCHKRDDIIKKVFTCFLRAVKAYSCRGVYLSFIVDQLKLSGVCQLDLRPNRHPITGLHPHKIPLYGEPEVVI